MNARSSGKLYYSISEVSEITELEPTVLRYWETEFKLRLKRSRAGNRRYRDKDIKLIQEIKRLTREEGYTIAGAKKKIQESYKDLDDAPEPTGTDTNVDGDLIEWIRSELLGIRAVLNS